MAVDAAEKLSIESVGPALESSYAVEACSLVVHGWGRGSRLPLPIFDAVVGAAGGSPVHVVQPSFCLAFTEAERALAGPVRVDVVRAARLRRLAAGGAIS